MGFICVHQFDYCHSINDPVKFETISDHNLPILQMTHHTNKCKQTIFYTVDYGRNFNTCLRSADAVRVWVFVRASMYMCMKQTNINLFLLRPAYSRLSTTENQLFVWCNFLISWIYNMDYAPDDWCVLVSIQYRLFFVRWPEHSKAVDFESISQQKR